MKIDFNILEKMSYDDGKKILFEAGYIQKEGASDKKEDYFINDEYFTLFSDDDEIIHEVSYVSYFKDNPNDESIPIDIENWHWSELNTENFVIPIQLYGQTEFAHVLGWEPKKFTAYWGKKNLRIPFPEPFAYVGKKPAWTLKQAENYKRQIEESKNH